jgi:hypothetical protein
MGSYFVTILGIAIVIIFGWKAVNRKKPITGESVFNFWEGIYHYPAWIQSNSEFVWPIVVAASEGSESGRMELTLKDGSLITVISKRETDYQGDECKDIEIFFNKEITCAFRASFRFDVTGGHYFLSNVEFIKDGEWQNGIRDFESWKIKNDKIMEEKTNRQLNEYRKKKMNKRLE